jgi:integrase
MKAKTKPVTGKKQGSVKEGLYKRGSIWYIRCKVNGVLIRKAIGPQKTKAEAVLAELKKERALMHLTGEMSGLQQLFKKKERRTFEEMCDQYLAERPHLKASTYRGYKEIFDNYLLPAFGHLYVDQITEELVAQFQATVSKKVSATRTNNIMGPLRYVLKVCNRRKLVSDNPALYVSPLKEEDPNIDPLTIVELNRALAAMKPRHRSLFTCLAWTGARPEELFALRWSDIDFNRNEIHITKGRVRGKESTTKTKSGRRVLYMLSIVREVLMELKRSPTQHVDGYIFLTKHGQPYDRHVDREWRTALKRADVRHRPSYQLRHTFASMCLQHGLQPTWVSKMLGHATLQITFKHYARFIKDSSTFNEQRLEDFVNSNSGTVAIVSEVGG